MADESTPTVGVTVGTYDPSPARGISEAHRDKAGRLAERMIDLLDSEVGGAIEEASWIADVAGAIATLDAISRGPVGR